MNGFGSHGLIAVRSFGSIILWPSRCVHLHRVLEENAHRIYYLQKDPLLSLSEVMLFPSLAVKKYLWEVRWSL